MDVNPFINDLAYTFAYLVGPVVIVIGGAFLAGAVLYGLTVVTIFAIRNE
jgi:hypothetical protein